MINRFLCFFALYFGLGFASPLLVMLANKEDIAFSPLGFSVVALVFVLALVGFGSKAGLLPIHFWLPHAHPAAPSHISALMSGVMMSLTHVDMVNVLAAIGGLSLR